jgi:hypothetical protein
MVQVPGSPKPESDLQVDDVTDAYKPLCSIEAIAEEEGWAMVHAIKRR